MDAFRLSLPATSANLGAAFDTGAVALDFYLTVEAEVAKQFSIEATGRNADLCGRLENNLILGTYTALLEREGRAVPPLALRMENQIPLGMGCGSSAAGRLMAICLAVHFGKVGWTADEILEEACALEGHPDNAAACWLGGLVVAACSGRKVFPAYVLPPDEWRALVVMPGASLATSEARAVLPATYSRADAVANIQSAALLGPAFAQGRGDLLRRAMQDRIHQPYRSELCALLPLLLPLAHAEMPDDKEGILGIALSGAGPAVLVIVSGEKAVANAAALIRAAIGSEHDFEIAMAQFAPQGGAAAFALLGSQG